MSARQELAKVIVAAYGEDAGSVCPCEQDMDVADAILAAGYSKPRTVSTVEELTAVPDMVALYSTKTKNLWVWMPKNAPALVAWGTGGGYTYETDFIKHEAPLTVMHEGGK